MIDVYDFRPQPKESYIVYADEAIPDTVVALQQGETPLLSIGDISTITGQPKSRKTYLITSIVVAFLSDNGFLSLNSDLTQKHVLVIDTEQSRQFVQRLVRRIYRLMEWDFSERKEELSVLSLRELTPEKRWEVVKGTIAELKPQLVFIDGSADLINDPNSQEESFSMVQNLMRLSTDEQCHICSVVHTNPSSDKTRGHFGSELQRKSETVMYVSREGDVTTVKPQFCRNLEFEAFSFTINERGLPQQCEGIQPAEQKADNLPEIFKEIFSYTEFLSYGDLIQALMDKLDKGRTACASRIKRGIDERIIYKGIDGMHRLYVVPKEVEFTFENSNNDTPF